MFKFLSNRTKKLASSLFGKSEFQNRMALSTVKLILNDIDVLYKEYRTHAGPGVLFFNPDSPNKSSYLNVKQIKEDLSRAEEFCDEGTAAFLKKVISMAERTKLKYPVVVMVEPARLSVHVLNIEESTKQLEDLASAVGKC